MARRLRRQHGTGNTPRALQLSWLAAITVRTQRSVAAARRYLKPSTAESLGSLRSLRQGFSAGLSTACCSASGSQEDGASQCSPQAARGWRCLPLATTVNLSSDASSFHMAAGLRPKGRIVAFPFRAQQAYTVATAGGRLSLHSNGGGSSVRGSRKQPEAVCYAARLTRDIPMSVPMALSTTPGSTTYSANSPVKNVMPPGPPPIARTHMNAETTT